MNALIKDALGESAIGAADHPLAADQLGKAHQAFRHQLRMLDDVGGMGDHAGQLARVRRQFGLLPHAPFVLVTRIGHFQRIAADFHAQDQIDDVLGRDVVGVRAVPASPADVIAALLLRDSLQRAIERRDLLLRPGVIIREACRVAPSHRIWRRARHRRVARSARRR